MTATDANLPLQNDHNVYILGAGFSREAGLPLISDFLVRMRDCHEWLQGQRRASEADAVSEALRFRLESTSAAYAVDLDLENIEELFSLASSTGGKIVTQTWKKVFEKQLEKIWETAITQLSTATRIVIIGFSIPGYFVTESKLEPVRVANPKNLPLVLTGKGTPFLQTRILILFDGNWKRSAATWSIKTVLVLVLSCPPHYLP